MLSQSQTVSANSNGNRSINSIKIGKNSKRGRSRLRASALEYQLDKECVYSDSVPEINYNRRLQQKKRKRSAEEEDEESDFDLFDDDVWQKFPHQRKNTQQRIQNGKMHMKSNVTANVPPQQLEQQLKSKKK
jgi:hypothetical protein